MSEVIELRRYQLRAGTRETLIELFDREFVETQEAVGMRVIGQFRDLDEPDEFVWLRGFADLDQRTRALAAFYGGPVWARHGPAANATMVNSDNVLLLRPAAPGTGFAPSARRRPGTGAVGAGRGLIVATVCHLAPRTDAAFSECFARAARPLLAAAGARIIAELVSEHGENGFPRLPVREGETVFAWLAGFADAAAYAAHLAALERCAAWRDGALPEMETRMWRRREVARLAPTARSLLHD